MGCLFSDFSNFSGVALKLILWKWTDMRKEFGKVTHRKQGLDKIGDISR